MTMTEFRIYVASLSDYNSGILHGRWIEVADADTMRSEIAAMLEESPTAKQEGQPAEEWAIHDYEFGAVHLSEFEDLDELAALAAGAEQHGEAFLAWVSHEPRHNRDVSDFEDAFLGQWDSLEAYVIDYWEHCGDVPQAPKGAWWHPANYTDWERMAHDLELSGDVFTIESSSGKVWVFSNR